MVTMAIWLWTVAALARELALAAALVPGWESARLQMEPWHRPPEPG